MRLSIEKLGFRTDINALRTFAVLGVIGYHFGIPGFSGGFAGVDVFFVISGYLISSQIQQQLLLGRFSLKEFYLSRLRRIFPALAVMCVCVVLFGWFYVLPEEYTEHVKTAFSALYFNANTGFATTKAERGYFDAVTDTVSPLLHTWSLSVEGQFYLFLPFVWVIAYQRLKTHLAKSVFFALMLTLVYFVYDMQHHTNASFYRLPVRAWEFLTGACLVMLPKYKFKPFVSNVINAAGSLALLACNYWLNSELLWPSYWTMIPVAATALILASPQATWNHWLFNNWLIQKMGDMSYSLYLWHWPLIVFAKQYATIVERPLSSLDVTFLLLATYCFAFLSWQFVEKPIRRNRHVWTNKTLLIFTLLILLAFWGGWRWVSLSNGLPWRLEKFVTTQQKKYSLYLPSYFKSCYSLNSVITKQDKLNLCEINSNSKQKESFLVWGDSHAQQYYPAFLRASVELDQNGLIATRQNCRPTLPNERSFILNEIEANSCIEFNNKINGFIQHSPDIKTIVVGRIWVHGESVDQTIALVKALTQMGKRVVLTGVIPNPKYRVPEKWVQYQTWTRTFITEISVPRDKDELPAITKYVHNQLADEIKNRQVVFMNAMDHFCNDTKCFYVKDGVENFFDMNHITEAKALEFTDEFKRALQP